MNRHTAGAFVGFMLAAIALGCIPPRHDAVSHMRDAVPSQVDFCYRIKKNGNVGVYLWRCPVLP